MALRLPQSQLSQAPRTSRQYDNSQAILQVMGQNPYAQAMDQVGPLLSKALQVRAERLRQAQQVAALEKSYGLNEGELKGIGSPETASAVGKYVAESRKPTMVNEVMPDGSTQLIQIPAGNKFGGNVKLAPPKQGGNGGYTIPRGLDPETNRVVYSDSKRMGLFFDDGKPFKGAPGALNLKPLPSDQIQKESDLATLQMARDKVKSSYDDNYVGPFAAKTGKAKQFFDVSATPQAATFYSNVSDLRNQLVYLRSGKQINEEEYKRLLSAVPNENMSPKDFKARMANFDQLLETIKTSRAGALSGSGYRKPALQPLPLSAPGGMKPPADGDKVTIRASDGSMHRLPRVNLDKAKQRDPGLQVVP